LYIVKQWFINSQTECSS